MHKNGEHTQGRPCEHCHQPAVVAVGDVWLCSDHAGVKSASVSERTLKSSPESLADLHRKPRSV
jgi:hypothetical protein